MNYKAKGKITEISEVVTGTTAKGEWQKVDFVIDTLEKYNNIVAFTIFGTDKVEHFGLNQKVGQMVDVEFNVSSREFKGKYYTDLKVWKCEPSASLEKDTSNMERVVEEAKQAGFVEVAGEDDLPF